MHFFSSRMQVMLGYACNHKCRYCVQALNGRKTGLTTEVSTLLIDKIELQADLVFPSPLKVTLFGGEPLLYDKAINQILDAVKATNIKWKLHTNGELLTQAHVDLFNTHHVQVGISHDGPNVLKTRGVNVFERPERIVLFNALENRSVDFVVTAYAQDFYAIRSYFNELFGRDDWRLKPAFLVNPSSVPQDMLAFDMVKWRETVEKVCLNAADQIIQGKTEAPKSWESKFVIRIMNDGLCQTSHPFVRLNQQCLVPNVDLSGRVFACERLGADIRKIKPNCSSDKEFEQRFLAHLITLHKNCLDCPAFIYCRGQCPSEEPYLAPTQCELLKVLYGQVDVTLNDLDIHARTQLTSALQVNFDGPRK